MRKSFTRIMSVNVTCCVLFGALLFPQLVSETTAITSFIARAVFNHNLHEVVKGRFFRAGQMSPQELQSIVATNRIRTVIDLRLDDDDETKKGESEELAVEEAGARYIHFPMRSSRVPRREKIDLLLSVYDQAEVPVLIHCSSGTHRAGVAAALWLIEKEGVDPGVALEQLSSRYGFFQFERKLKALYQGHPTLDTLILRFVEDHRATGISLRHWLDEYYPREAQERKSIS